MCQHLNQRQAKTYCRPPGGSGLRAKPPSSQERSEILRKPYRKVFHNTLRADRIPICVWEGWLDADQGTISASLGGHQHPRLVEGTFLAETEILHHRRVSETEQGTGKGRRNAVSLLSLYHLFYLLLTLQSKSAALPSGPRLESKLSPSRET